MATLQLSKGFRKITASMYCPFLAECVYVCVYVREIESKCLYLRFAVFLYRFGRNAKIIHFIGPVKPWQHQYVPGVDSVVLAPGTYSSQSAAYDFIRMWWQVFNRTQEVSIVPLFHETV